MQSIRNLRYLELFTNVARAFCSTIQKWKKFVISPDKIAFSLPTKWGDFYKTDNADWRRFIKCLHFKRDKILFSLPTKWEGFYKAKYCCLVGKKFFWESSSVFRSLCNSGIMRDFFKEGRGCKNLKVNEKNRRALLQCIYEGVIKKFKFIWAFWVFRVLV